MTRDSLAGGAGTTIVCLVAALLLLPASIGAQEQGHEKRQALLLLKTLSFDGRLDDWASREVTVAVLTSKAGACDSMGRSLKDAASDFTVRGHPVRSVQIDAGADLEGQLREATAAAVFLCPDYSAGVSALLKVTRKLSVLSFTGREDHVDAGVSVGILARDDKIALVVNLGSARAERAQLDPKLLRLAEVRQ